MTISPPTQAGFVVWLRLNVGITTGELPDNSPFIPDAYAVALAIVNQQLNASNPLIYTLAVYNLATDNLINWAQDTPPSTYFADLRKKLDCLDFYAGTISAASDEGTSDSIATIETMTAITIGQLQNLKTPYGRQYLAYASMVGTNWGLS